MWSCELYLVGFEPKFLLRKGLVRNGIEGSLWDAGEKGAKEYGKIWHEKWQIEGKG